MKPKQFFHAISDRLVFLFPILCGVLAFILYESTNAKGLFWGDAGELISAANTMGIVHPYGHPLFWLLGRITILLAPSHPAAIMNHLTAFFSASTCVVIAFIVKQCIPKSTITSIRILITFIVTTLYATATTVWTQSTFTEVYNYQAFFIALSVFFFMKFIDQKKSIANLYMSVYSFGIALTLGYYILILIILPLLSIKKLISRRVFHFRTIIFIMLFLFLGLSILFYLPIRSSVSPSFSWYQINSFQSFLNYMTRIDSRQVGFAGKFALMISIVEAGRILFQNLGILGMILLLTYCIINLTKRITYYFSEYLISALFTFLIFSILVPLNLTLRQMVDMDVYFIPSLILLIPPLTIGTYQLLLPLRKSLKAILLVPLILSIVVQAPSINISNKQTFERFSTYLLSCIPEHYLILPASDEIAHPIFYQVFSKNNTKHFRLPDFKLESNILLYKSMTIRDSILIEINDYFLKTFVANDDYHIAGPFIVPPHDSITAQRLEFNFIQQFSPENLNMNTLNRLDRLSLARIWARRGVYWYYLFNKTIHDTAQAKYIFNKTFQSFHNALAYDDFTFESVLHSNNLALVYMKMNDFSQAELLAKKSLKIDKHSETAIRILYTIAAQKGDYANAIKQLHKLSILNPNNGDIHLDIAVLYHLSNQSGKAKLAYNKGIKLGAQRRMQLETILFGDN